MKRVKKKERKQDLAMGRDGKTRLKINKLEKVK